jgi:hypothetical protein
MASSRTAPRSLVSVALIGVLVLIAACQTRSISDSGYRGDSYSYYGRSSGSNPLYRGELSDFDVLGIDSAQVITEAQILSAFNEKQPLSVKKGTSILLVQSGAIFPDTPMLKAFEKYYTVAGLTGVPERANAPGAKGSASREPDTTPNSYAMTLRLAAAKGGYEKIVAYWGVLETARESQATKAVSWVPFVGGAIPDEQQRMRIRLKLAVIDTRSGQWEMFTPEDFQDDAWSASYTRASSDQAQVAVLKEKAYASAAEDFVKRYAR